MLRLLVLAACLPSLARAQPCELEGTLSLDDLKVAVAGDSFRVRIRNASVRVQPTRDDPRVEVDASLRFTATTSEMPWFIRTRVDTEHGMLSLTPSVRIDHVRGAAGELTAVVHLNPWVHIRRVRLPCGAVVIERDRVEEPPALERDDVDGDGRLFRPRRSVLSIHSTPHPDSPRIRARLDREAPFMLFRIGRRGAWYRVEWTDGSSRIRGWVRRADMRPSERHGWGSTGGTGTPGCMPRGRASIHGGYEGPAEIAEGTEVLYTPNGARWATVGTGRFVVRWAPNDTHAAIVEASGVMVGTSCGIDHAYVPREAVTPRPTTRP